MLKAIETRSLSKQKRLKNKISLMGIKNSNEQLLISVGKNIRKVREERAISQEKLAELVNMHRTYIGLLERGQRNPTTTTLYKISKALKVQSATILKF